MSITVYSRTTCGPCKTVKGWLNNKNLTFIEKNLDDYPEYEAEVLARSGFLSVPVTIVDDQTIVGPNLALLSRLLMV